MAPGTCPYPLDKWFQFGLGSMLFLDIAGTADSGFEKVYRLPSIQLIAAGILTVLFAYSTKLSPSDQALALQGIAGYNFPSEQPLTCLVVVGCLGLIWPIDQRFANLRLLRPFMWIGSFSYSLYLTHMLLMSFIIVEMMRLGFDGSLYWVTLLTVIATSLLVAWIFYFVVERHFISSRQKRRLETELG
jgi:peptidoglycan/LPS O-acetylase OafA/YrhL